MDRATFLKSLTAISATATVIPVSLLVAGCAASVPSLHVQLVNKKAIVPRAQLPDLSQPNSYAKVYVDQYANPIILFAEMSGKFRAVLSTCAHSGCEVNKLRTKFECPCHGSEYDLQGNVLKGPAPESLETFQVQEFTDRIEIFVG
jgi:Rieske Fe-S protein